MKNKIENLNDIQFIIKDKDNYSPFYKRKIMNHIIITVVSILLILFLLLIYNFKRKNEIILQVNKRDIKEETKNIYIEEANKCANYSNNEFSNYNPGYKLMDNKSKIIDYSIKATYSYESVKMILNIINSSYIKDIIQITLNNKIIEISPNYTFSNIGNYTFYLLLKNPSKSLSKMFHGNKN